MSSASKYRVDSNEPPLAEMDPGSTTGVAGAGDEKPEIGSLTTDNLNLHLAFLQQSSPTGSTPAGEVRTLGMQDPSVLERRALYSNRKESRRQARNGRSAGRKSSRNFLSNVPEVEADVDYRFNFVVVGLADLTSDRVIEMACESPAAQELSSSRGGNNSRAPKANRCLCQVTGPVPARSSSGNPEGQQKLAKLVFNAASLGRELPSCLSRLEALSTALVFVLGIESKGGASSSFREQLQNLSSIVEQQRTTTRARFRPVRAVILCSQAEASGTGDNKQEDWTVPLADFEAEHGDMWKFGPIPVEDDGNGLHAAFAEMAAVRIAQGHAVEGGLTGPGSEGIQEPEEEEKEDGEHFERALLERQMEDRTAGVSGGAHKRSGSETPSDCSEGWQRPPVFEAEYEGSECSEECLERHAKMYGVDLTAEAHES